MLKALGRRSEDGAYLRFTVGRFNTPEEIDIALDIIAEVVAELRTIYE